MTRRSPHNDRYRKEANLGSTRRSASSMKPKRKAAEPTAKNTSTAAKGKTTATVAGRLPDTPEVRFYNRLYLALFAVAIVSLLPMLIANFGLKTTLPAVVTPILWGLYAAAIGGALYVQTGPLRKLKVAALKGELPSQQAEKAAKVAEKDEKKAAAGRTGSAGTTADTGGETPPSGDTDSDAGDHGKDA